MRNALNRKIKFINILIIFCVIFFTNINVYGNGTIDIDYNPTLTQVTITFNRFNTNHYNIILSKRVFSSTPGCNEHVYEQVSSTPLTTTSHVINYTFNIAKPILYPVNEKMIRSDYKVTVKHLASSASSIVNKEEFQEFIIAHVPPSFKIAQCHNTPGSTSITGTTFSAFRKINNSSQQAIVPTLTETNTGDLLQQIPYQEKHQFYFTASVGTETSGKSATLLFFISVPEKPSNITVVKSLN